MATDTSGDQPAPHVLQQVRPRLEREAAIRAGTVFPTTADLYSGLPYFKDRLEDDARTFYTELLLDKDYTPSEQAILEHARATTTPEAIEATIPVVRQGQDRLQLYLACLGDDDRTDELVLSLLRPDAGLRSAASFHVLYRMAVAIGFSRGQMHPDVALESGMSWIKQLATTLETYRQAEAALQEQKPAAESPGDLIAQFRAALTADARAAEAEDEIPHEHPLAPPVTEPASMVVVPRLDAGKVTGFKKEIYKSWADLAGTLMPIRQVGNPLGHIEALAARWPYCRSVIEAVVGDFLQSSTAIPTLLVGEPGTGKSELLRAIADELGLPSEQYNLGGVHDASVMGTSAQWNSAREAVPLQVIKRTGVPNPVLIWDEIEKAGADNKYGSPLDALLAMLEPSQSARYRDLCLEVECDLSAVSNLATCNSLEALPAPLRDRMRILEMPQPSWEHAPVLVANLLDAIAKQRRLDRRWLPDLDGEEWSVVEEHWRGGSIRRLRRIIEILLSARERFSPRA